MRSASASSSNRDHDSTGPKISSRAMVCVRARRHRTSSVRCSSRRPPDVHAAHPARASRRRPGPCRCRTARARLVFVDHRAHRRVGIERMAGLQRPCLPRPHRDEFVLDRTLHQQARGRRADFALVVEDAAGRGLGRTLPGPARRRTRCSDSCRRIPCRHASCSSGRRIAADDLPTAVEPVNTRPSTSMCRPAVRRIPAVARHHVEHARRECRPRSRVRPGASR
jgi:hypothetical protein